DLYHLTPIIDDTLIVTSSKNYIVLINFFINAKPLSMKVPQSFQNLINSQTSTA
ncbi:hypothetical protein J6590_087642, partial [Homalodisca vitripennis]